MIDRGESKDSNLLYSGNVSVNGSVNGNGKEVVESARLADSVTSIAGVRALAPGLRDLVATATAKVLRRTGDEPVGVDVTRGGDGVKVRIDAHLDHTRSVAEVVDEIFSVIETDIARGAVEVSGRLDIDLRVVSRG
ncbi:hypothetical protein [Brevibacterium aurantiacum]|uniref:Uncharacterized protein n=1 Tax=Brevibacterium aurantiacum TaxID=273384 RepID=A0A556CQV0_BREAU|nr:hypothetical protein [Brevibacterium aurantiacum]TSI19809.1 hypothetical protein FO013_02365 [Brevibacterium aurantiacum]